MSQPHDHYMALALDAARSSRRIAPPNPWVGAVIVKDGDVLATGSTRAPGGAHAEVVALEDAGQRARGATLYVTLEPCSHHGRTPPCVDAVIASGISRVVVGVRDPDARVSGAGIDALRAAGIGVECDVMADAVREQLAPYLWHRSTGRPYVVAKVASTLDGRVAMADGSSKWITSDDARLDAHELRADSQAIIVGAGTVRSDDPTLTARTPAGTFEPLRVVLGLAPEHAKVRPCLERSGDLSLILDELGELGVLQVLVEGGPTVTSAFVRDQLVNRVVWYLAPALAGSNETTGALSGLSTDTIDRLRRGRFLGVVAIGEDIRVDLEV